MQALIIFFNIRPDFAYTVQADIVVIVLYAGTMFMKALLIHFSIFGLILLIPFRLILLL
jgi:hypothetical protein